MAGDLKFIIGAVDNASKVLAGVGKETEKLGAATAKMNAASRLVGAGAIIAFGVSSVKAYAEAEAQQVKLQEAYRKFPAIASVSIESMRSLNSAIQAKTGTDDDELAAAEAKLAMYNLTGQQIQKLIPLVNDYATANGIGVTEAAGKVGKAMMGNAKALKDVGINFKATGDSAKDFDGIYTALEGKVGGAGEAFGQSTAGQLKILEASFSDLQEEVGAQLVPALKSLVDIAVPLLGAFGKLPEPVKSATVMIAGAAAAALLLGPRLIMLGNALQGLVPKAAEAAVALESEAVAAETAGTASSGAAGKIGTLGKAMGAIGIGVSVTIAVAEAYQYLLDKVGAGSDAVNGLADAVKQQDKAAAASALTAYNQAQAVADWKTQLLLLGSTWGVAAPAVVAGFVNAGKASENLGEELAKMVAAGDGGKAAQMVSALGLSAEDAAAKFPAYAQALADAKKALGPLASDADVAAAAIGTLDETTAKSFDSVKYLKEAADQLKSSLAALGGKAISVDDATAGLEASYDSAAETAKKLKEETDKLKDATTSNGAALDLSTESGRSAQSALKDIAKSADDMAESYQAAGKPTDQIRAKTDEARKKFESVAQKMGLTKDAAKELARQYGLVPDKVNTAVSLAHDEEVLARIKTVKTSLSNLDGRTATVVVNVNGRNLNLIAPGSLNADGGPISGAGTGTSDSIPAMLSNGEYVIRAAAAARLGMGFLDDLNDNGQIDGRQKLARGGSVHGDPLLSRQRVMVDRIIAAQNEQKFTTQVVVNLDSKTVAEGLANYRRVIGGRSLGLS